MGWQRRMGGLPGPWPASGEASNGQPVQVEIYLSGAWADITSYVMTRDGSFKVEITRGQSGEGSQVEASTCRFQINNRDGRFSPRNPTSPYYGVLSRNTPLRVSVPGPTGGKCYRFWGEVTKWPQGWDTTGTDVWVDVDAGGPLRRLEKGAAPTRSVLYNAVTADASSLLAYWPCEDADGATRIASGVAHGSAAVISGTPQLATFDRFGASDPLPVMTDASWRGGVTRYSAVTAAQVRFLLFIPAAGVSDGKIIASVSMDSTSIATWELYYSTGGTVTLRPLDGDGATLAGGVSAFGDVDGKYLWVSIELQQNGANIDCAVRLYNIDTGDTTSSTGALNAKTLARVTAVSAAPAQVLGAATKGLTDGAIGHVTVQNAVTSITELGGRLNPSGEAAGRRFQRVCAEHGIAFDGVGDLADTVLMGPQAKLKPLDLLTECSDADGGMLFENLAVFGLGYRTRASLYNQDAALTLSYPSGQLSEVPTPVDDDQLVRNQITVNRTAGGVPGTASLGAGAMSTADPPEGIGVYGEDATLNVEDEDQLPDLASWRLHLGTVDEARYPQISVNLAHPQFTGNPALKAQVLGLRPGDRVVIADPPAWLPPDDISQLVIGFGPETIDHFEHRITLVCTPESPWRVGYVENAVYGRVDTDGTGLAEDLDTTETAVDVLTTSGDIWTTDSADYPFDLRVGGETMTATACASSVIDAFGRSVSNGWGAADSGQSWTTVGGAASDYSVSGGLGNHSLGSVNVSRRTVLTAVSPDFDITVTVATDKVATGGSHFVYLVGRYQDITNYYLARLEFTTAQAVILDIQKLVSGFGTSLGPVALTNLTHGAGTRFGLRFQVYGSALKAKAWLASGAEPYAWDTEVTDTGLTAAGNIGVRSILDPANTNVLPVVASFDSFALLNPQTFTVTRSVNGVAKAHSAGADVSLANPTIVAL